MTAETQNQPIADASAECHAFLLRTAELLHQYGTPSYRLEAVMQRISDDLNVPSVYLYTPTALFISLGEHQSEKMFLRRIESTDVDVGRILAFDAVLEDLEARKISVIEAAAKMEEIASAPEAFPPAVSVFSAAVACAGVAILFGGQLYDACAAAFLGCLVTLAAMAASGGSAPRGWLEPLLGFGTAFAAVVMGLWLPISPRLITLAALILPIPGLSLTVALTELAAGHLASGSARVAGAAVQLLTLVAGVAIAWQLTAPWFQEPPNVADISQWWLWVAVAIAPIAFAVVFKVPVSQWPVIMTVVLSGFCVSQILQSSAGPEFAAFGGALAVGCGSNIYARVKNRPAMVPSTPGLLILVPGSIGYNSLTAMVQSDTLKGVELAFQMSMTAAALAVGLLLANVVISPRRNL